MAKPKKKGAPKRREPYLPIDIRDRRIPDGRVTLSSRTRDEHEYVVRKGAVLRLLDMDEDGMEALRRLRARTLRIEQIAEALVDARKAPARLAELLAAPAERVDPAEVPPILLGATIDRYLRRVEAHASAGTLEQYTGLARNLESTLGVRREEEAVVADVEIGSITAEQREGWLYGDKATHKRPWSARRQKVAHAVAHQIWALAIAADKEATERAGVPRRLTENPWAKGEGGLRPPRIRKTRVIYLSRVQAGRMLWAARGRPQALAFALGLYAGLRGGEVRNLRTETDVDRKRAQLQIQPRDGEHPWRPKTDNSIRNVPISRRLMRWIRAHERAGYAGERYLIHPANADRPLARSTLIRWTMDTFAVAEIGYGRDAADAATYHTLRHTFASWLVRRDTQLMKVAKLMGDTTDEVERTYAHLLPDDLVAPVELMGRR